MGKKPAARISAGKVKVNAKGGIRGNLRLTARSGVEVSLPLTSVEVGPPLPN